ncbi:GntR family transcriptional regulator [Veronia nyctiphanis]|uniref:GntR family transcriptional regulator n=1 Tax=Veronia nyctiphanis TaxID=1278244 RepID=A0A4Q0YRW3_9GAMM|nr:GntR family transcriptional regulator [Veronia nyctiphanis]RXJ72864.1 GntR family transcriptional regulator [Veronia nyctiphanis]
MSKPTHFMPLYAQVKELLTQRLIDKVWTPGMALPSEFQLADELSVSQGTVRKALDEMAAEKLVIRRQGKGTYVAEHTQEQPLYHFFRFVDNDGNRHLPDSKLESIVRKKATPLEARSLGLKNSDKVVRIHRVRWLGGQPVINEVVSLPDGLFDNAEVPSDLPNILYSYYQQDLGVSIVKVSEKLTAESASASDHQTLGVEVGTPILQALRVAYSLDGRAVEMRQTRCHTDQYHYLNELT